MEEKLLRLSVSVVPFLLAITLHEYAHGWVADRLGDPTARLQGRLTLNPFRHLDIVGTLALLFAPIGWAKPVPVNPLNFRHPRRDMVWVAIAGPAMNMALAAVSALVYKGLVELPLAGGMTAAIGMPLVHMVKTSVILNVALAAFNVLPVPPLDGGRVVHGLLPARHAAGYQRLEPMGFVIVLGLILLGVVDYLIFPAIHVALTVFRLT